MGYGSSGTPMVPVPPRRDHGAQCPSGPWSPRHTPTSPRAHLQRCPACAEERDGLAALLGAEPEPSEFSTRGAFVFRADGDSSPWCATHGARRLTSWPGFLTVHL